MLTLLFLKMWKRIRAIGTQTHAYTRRTRACAVYITNFHLIWIDIITSVFICLYICTIMCLWAFVLLLLLLVSSEQEECQHFVCATSSVYVSLFTLLLFLCGTWKAFARIYSLCQLGCQSQCSTFISFLSLAHTFTNFIGTKQRKNIFPLLKLNQMRTHKRSRNKECHLKHTLFGVNTIQAAPHGIYRL